jgi:hypothetical protein
MTARSERRDHLFDLLVASPLGVTIIDIRDELGSTLSQARRAVQDLRRFLGDFDDVNVPAVSQGYNQRWLYTLVQGMTDATRWWTANRIVDTASRLVTMHAVAASIVRATDGRTIEGRKARMIEVGLRHLIEDLQTIGE